MTLRIVGMLRNDWDTFDGWAASRNVDPLRLPLKRLLSLAYFWATDGGEPSDIARFDAHLWQPPKGVVPTTGPWSPEAEMTAFRAAKAELG